MDERIFPASREPGPASEERTDRKGVRVLEHADLAACHMDHALGGVRHPVRVGPEARLDPVEHGGRSEHGRDPREARNNCRCVEQVPEFGPQLAFVPGEVEKAGTIRLRVRSERCQRGHAWKPDRPHAAIKRNRPLARDETVVGLRGAAHDRSGRQHVEGEAGVDVALQPDVGGERGGERPRQQCGRDQRAGAPPERCRQGDRCACEGQIERQDRQRVAVAVEDRREREKRQRSVEPERRPLPPAPLHHEDHDPDDAEHGGRPAENVARVPHEMRGRVHEGARHEAAALRGRAAGAGRGLAIWLILDVPLLR